MKLMTSALNARTILERVMQAPDPAARAELCEEALQQVRRDDSPMLWGSLQGVLAASVATANGQRYTEPIFQKVLQGYQSALSVFSPNETPEEWADTLRNIGATHTDAVNSGLGNKEAHIEAAIAALRQAATISAAAAADIRIGALAELASALRTAAAWRGSAALLECARIYADIVSALPADARPELRASMNAHYVDAVVAAGDTSRAGQAVTACDQALEFYNRDQNPVQWAQLQLWLGALLRGSPDGDRAENLERAAAALDAALTVFTETDFPDKWIQAHYERGPVLVFRTGGDRNENLRHALESLRIALAAISRDEAPDQWAAVQVTLAQALLDRTDGDSQARIEEAIPVLEAALEALPDREPLAVWILGQRFLGMAYLEREAGDAADNIERCIVALDAAQSLDTARADLNAWTATQGNLAEAYGRRLLGDPQQNRTRSMAAFEAALSVPFDRGRPVQEWGSALAQRTVWAGRVAGYRPPPRSRTEQGDQEDLEDWADASFAAGMAAARAIHHGEQGLALDPHWHVPFMVEDDAASLQHQLIRFLNSGTMPTRDASSRSRLEIERHATARRLVYQLEERRLARHRTETLLHEIRVEGRPFVLYLRGFNNRVTRFADGMVSRGTGNLEWFALTDLVTSIAPMPLVWIVNPIDSPAIDQMVAETKPDGMGFRIEAGDEWERHVRALIASASFIVMHNDSMTPGVAAEIGVLGELGRLGETLFEDADAANQATGRTDCRRIDERALAAIAHHTTPRIPTVELPPAMCPWAGGARRTDMEREGLAIHALGKRLEEVQQPVLADLELDVCAWLLGQAVLLEGREALASHFARQAALFKSLRFRQAKALAADCLRLSAQLGDA